MKSRNTISLIKADRRNLAAESRVRMYSRCLFLTVEMNVDATIARVLRFTSDSFIRGMTEITFMLP